MTIDALRNVDEGIVRVDAVKLAGDDQFCTMPICRAASSVQLNIQFLRLCRAPHNHKNYLLAGSDAGTAKLNGLDAEAYLGAVLSRIADHPINRIEELLPWQLEVDAVDPPREVA